VYCGHITDHPSMVFAERLGATVFACDARHRGSGSGLIWRARMGECRIIPMARDIRMELHILTASL